MLFDLLSNIEIPSFAFAAFDSKMTSIVLDTLAPESSLSSTASSKYSIAKRFCKANEKDRRMYTHAIAENRNQRKIFTAMPPPAQDN